jgi:excisionase family DNA binding protein
MSAVFDSAAATLPRQLAVLLSVVGVAELLGCSERHVYRMSDANKMPRPVKLGALVRWSRTDLETWIAGGCKPVRK